MTDRSHIDGKGRIGQAKAKRIKRLHVERVKITIAHIDVFRIILIIYISVVGGKRFGGRIVLIPLRPGVGQFAGRIDFACQDIREHIPADVPKLAHQQHGIDPRDLLQRCQIHDTADVQDDDRFFVKISHAADIVEFLGMERIVARRIRPVGPLTGIPRDHIDRRVRFRLQFGRRDQKIRRLQKRHAKRHQKIGDAALLRLGVQLLLIIFFFLTVVFRIAVQPVVCNDRHAGVF